jgi:hypothetical protein
METQVTQRTRQPQHIASALSAEALQRLHDIGLWFVQRDCLHGVACERALATSITIRNTMLLFHSVSALKNVQWIKERSRLPVLGMHESVPSGKWLY